MAILIKWNILCLFFACVESGKGSLEFLRVVLLTASHEDTDWALGQTANAVDGTTLTCTGWWVTVAEHRLSPGSDKWLC